MCECVLRCVLQHGEQEDAGPAEALLSGAPLLSSGLQLQLGRSPPPLRRPDTHQVLDGRLLQKLLRRLQLIPICGERRDQIQRAREPVQQLGSTGNNPPDTGSTQSHFHHANSARRTEHAC